MYELVVVGFGRVRVRGVYVNVSLNVFVVLCVGLSLLFEGCDRVCVVVVIVFVL